MKRLGIIALLATIFAAQSIFIMPKTVYGLEDGMPVIVEENKEEKKESETNADSEKKEQEDKKVDNENENKEDKKVDNEISQEDMRDHDKKDKCENKDKKCCAPKIVKVEQESCDTIKITFDKDVDCKKAKKQKNYWIQSVCDDKAEGIATLGKNDKVCDSNSLTKHDAKIKSTDDKKVFCLKFKKKITSGKKYKIIVCNIGAESQKDYTGDNGSLEFVGK